MAEIMKIMSLDVARKNRIPAVVAKQYDKDSRFLRVRLRNEGRAIYVEKTSTVTINMRRLDGEAKAFLGAVNEDGTVKVPLANWLLEKEGRADCDVTVIDTEGRKLTTQSFSVEIVPAEFDGDSVSEDTGVDVLTGLILEVQAYTEAETARRKSEDARMTAENARLKAETLRSQKETERTSAEEMRLTKENERIAAEDARIDAELLRSEAEAERENAEAQRILSENERMNEEETRVSAENARETAEASRASAESRRASAETSRMSAENARVSAERSRTYHYSSRNNPHNVTKSQIGLSNVTNDAQVKRSEMGEANGVAVLNALGEIPEVFLPPYLTALGGVVTNGEIERAGLYALQVEYGTSKATVLMSVSDADAAESMVQFVKLEYTSSTNDQYLYYVAVSYDGGTRSFSAVGKCFHLDLTEGIPAMSNTQWNTTANPTRITEVRLAVPYK